LAAAAPAVPAARPYKPVIAAAVYVWTQQLNRQKRTLADGLEEIFTGTAGAGYKTVELMSNVFEGDLAGRTIGYLKQYKLALPSVYRGGVYHVDAEAAKTIQGTLALADLVKPLGVVAINTNCNPKPKKEPKTGVELDIQLRAINTLAGELKKKGMKLFIHQHDPEMANGAREWRHILMGSDPSCVQFNLDTHWVYRGGQDVMTLLKECGPRLGSLHLRQSKNGVWTEDIGEGDIDHPQIASYLKSIGFQGWLIVELAWDKETPITRPLTESLRLSRLYVERVFKR
jgi:inosose dehydratase